jgi:hypothetical protein
MRLNKYEVTFEIIQPSALSTTIPGSEEVGKTFSVGWADKDKPTAERKALAQYEASTGKSLRVVSIRCKEARR